MRRLLPWEWLDRLTGSDRQKRKKAVGRVCQLASADPAFISVLRDALAHPNDDIVFWIVTHLWSLGASARVAVPELIRLLARQPAFGIRQMVLTGLAEIAPDGAEVKATIFGAFNDPDPHVRLSALRAAIRVVEILPEDLTRIREMAGDPDEYVASWSETALRNIDSRHKKSS